MNLPIIISELVKAQNNFDNRAFANCFTETAVVYDEGKTHHGRIEIENWIAKANTEFKTQMNLLEYNERENILSAEISGTFPGSPVVLNYHLKIFDGLIQSMKITG